MSAKGEVDLDSQVRGVEANQNVQKSQSDTNTSDCLEMLLSEAVKLLKQAENEVKVRQLKVKEIQKKLEEVKLNEKKEMEAKKRQELSPEEELKRRAAVRRKWRILGMKVRVGITANIVRRRKINDANSFLDKETEAVTKEDNLDLEGKCEQKKVVKSKWRKGGTLPGITQGRDSAF